MPDIMVSYAHADRPRIRPIVEMLEDEGWEVWWDRGIEPGTPWLDELDDVLRDCRCVLVVWSKASRESEWVHKEARIGEKKNALVPAMIEPGMVPDEFAHLQALDLSSWNGRRDLTEIDELLSKLNRLAPPSRIDTVRPGYDPSFLGDEAEVTMPGVTGSAAIYRYLHFTVVMNPGRRMAHYSAYNMDGSAFVKVPRGREAWAADPLLPKSLQLDMPTTRKSDYQRGHLVSRQSVMWGDDRLAGIAGQQAFYWTNVTPQTPLLNTRTWLVVEQWERGLAEGRRRASGFAGPVLTHEDPPYRGEVTLEDGVVARDTMHIPQAFWKVVVIRGDDGLEVACFLIGQDRKREAGGVAPYAVELKAIEDTSGVRFGDELHRAGRIPLA